VVRYSSTATTLTLSPYRWPTSHTHTWTTTTRARTRRRHIVDGVSIHCLLLSTQRHPRSLRQKRHARRSHMQWRVVVDSTPHAHIGTRRVVDAVRTCIGMPMMHHRLDNVRAHRSDTYVKIFTIVKISIALTNMAPSLQTANPKSSSKGQPRHSEKVRQVFSFV
jgi:hypothetical protein